MKSIKILKVLLKQKISDDITQDEGQRIVPYSTINPILVYVIKRLCHIILIN